MKYSIFLFGALAIPFLAFAHSTGMAHIDVLPAVLDYGAGTEIPLEVRIRAPEAITALRIHLTYDPAVLEVSEVKPNTETFPYWWKQEATNGVITLEASLPKPGFTGESLVAGLVVTTKAAGSQLLQVDQDASLLLNAQDQNILELGEEEETQSRGAVAALAVLLGSGAILGVVLFLRGRKR